MAEKQVTVTEVEKNEIVERAKDFWAQFSKPIIYIGGAVILLAGGWLGYKNLVKVPNEAKSAEQIFPAEQLFDKMTQSGFNKDSIAIVLNGGNGITGVLKVQVIMVERLPVTGHILLPEPATFIIKISTMLLNILRISLLQVSNLKVLLTECWEMLILN